MTEWTLERRAQFAADMKARREAKKTLPSVEEPKVPTPEAIDSKPEESSATEVALRVEVQELKDMMLKAFANQTQQSGIGVGNNGKLLGEVEKYALDPNQYQDPTKRLSDEPRLQPMAFKLNYELEYEMSVSHYETKTGVNQKEPEFLVTLMRVVLDDQGLPTDKRYIARRMVFHEDPQAAIVIARDNGINLDEFKDLDNTTDNQKFFLNEMRYLRVRDWLFDVFWPQPIKKENGIREEVIGGSIVQVFVKSSEEPSGVDFDQIKTVIR